MSVSEGPPVLTPEQEDELRLYAMRPEGHGLRVSRSAVAGVLAELAREREVRERAEHDAATVRHHDACETTRADRAEGRVRKLREALGRIENFPYDVARDGETELRQVKEIAREALVGLPEREYVHCGCDHHGDHAGCDERCKGTGCTEALVGLPEGPA